MVWNASDKLTRFLRKVVCQTSQNKTVLKRNHSQILCMLGQPNPLTVLQYTAPSVLQGMQIYVKTIKSLFGTKHEDRLKILNTSKQCSCYNFYLLATHTHTHVQAHTHKENRKAAFHLQILSSSNNFLLYSHILIFE